MDAVAAEVGLNTFTQPLLDQGLLGLIVLLLLAVVVYQQRKIDALHAEQAKTAQERLEELRTVVDVLKAGAATNAQLTATLHTFRNNQGATS